MRGERRLKSLESQQRVPVATQQREHERARRGNDHRERRARSQRDGSCGVHPRDPVRGAGSGTGAQNRRRRDG